MSEFRQPGAADTQGTSQVDEKLSSGDKKAALHRRRIRAYKVLLPILIFIGIIAWSLTTNYIPSESMLPALRPGDHILTTKSWLAYPGGRAPARGDIVVFALPVELPNLDHISSQDEKRQAAEDMQKRVHIPPGSLRRIKGDVLIKRVAGLPGETIRVSGKDIFINGSKISHRYFGAHGEIDADMQYNFAHLQELTLKDDEVFVLGDNVENSEDGRSWGPLKRRNILGKFVRVLWNDGGKLAVKTGSISETSSP